jgi:hypothetical protein
LFLVWLDIAATGKEIELPISKKSSTEVEKAIIALRNRSSLTWPVEKIQESTSPSIQGHWSPFQPRYAYGNLIKPRPPHLQILK